jgi:hypothetical protein
MTPEALFTAALQLEAGWKVTECRFEGEPPGCFWSWILRGANALDARSAASFARRMTPASSAGGT